MKFGVYLVNIVRVCVFDYDVLVDALCEGWFGGVGFDVFFDEFLLFSSFFFDLFNVMFMLYIGGVFMNVVEY